MKNLFRLAHIGFVLLLFLGSSSCTFSDGVAVRQSPGLLAGYTDSLIQANPDSVLTVVRTYENMGSVLDAQLALKQAVLELKLAAYEARGNRDSVNFVIQELANSHLLAGDTLPLVDLLQMAATEDDTYLLIIKNMLQIADQYLERHSLITPEAVAIKMELANTLIGDNDFAEATQVLERAIDATHQLDIQDQDALIYLSFGKLYLKQNLFPQAKDNYQKALSLTEGVPAHFSNYLRALNNLGVTYRELGQLDSAVYCYQQVLDTIAEDQIIPWLQNTLNIANIYTIQGDYDRAIRQYQQVIKTSIDNQIGIGAIYGKMNLANAWVEQGQYAKGIELLLAVEAEVEAQGSPELAYRIKGLLEEAYLEAGQFRNAYELTKQIKLYKDSVQTSSNQSLVSDLEYFYKNDRQTLQNELLRARKRLHSNWLKGLLVLLLGLLTLGWMVIGRYQQQKQFAQKYKVAVGEKEKALKAKSLAIQETERLQEQLLAEERHKTEKLTRQIELLREELLTMGINLYLANDDRFWLNFSLSFQLLFPDFETEFCSKYPDLTLSDIQYCKLVRLNLSNEVIADILHVAPRSIYAKRQRILEKMGVAKGEDKDLFDYFPS